MNYPLQKRILAPFSAVAVLLLAMPALAQAPADGDACPPGAFCEEIPAEPPPEKAAPEKPAEEVPAEDAPAEAAGNPDGEAGSPDSGDSTSRPTEAGGDAAGNPDGEEEEGPVTVVLPPAKNPAKPRTFTYHPDPNGGPGQVVIYEGEPGNTPSGHDSSTVQHRRAGKEGNRKRVRRHRRWGMNLRVEGALMPQYYEDAANDTGMAGLGFSLRYRPVPAFALDMSLDFLGGVDASGLERQEIPLSVGGILYANPKNVVQFYLMGGINWAFARVFSDQELSNLAEGTQDDYTYFGGYAGVGLEFRVSKLVGLNLDGLGFVRTRTDDDQGGLYPEFIDQSRGQYSNSSAGGLLRAGATFWW